MRTRPTGSVLPPIVVALVLFSVLSSVYHFLAHQAPLLPTILGQWLLLLTALVFASSAYYALGQTATDDERATVSVRTCAAYVLGALIALAYASHQYVTPVAEVGLDVVFFETVFTASAVGTAGSVIGLKAVRHERALSRARENQRDLHEEQALVEGTLDALPDVFYAFDDEGQFFEWNERLTAVTGYSDDEIESMHPTELVAEGDRAKVTEAMRRVFTDDETVTIEAQFETKGGERIPYEFTGSKITRPDGESLGLVGIGRNLSQLKEQRQRFRAVFDNTYQFIGLTDTDGEIIEANETALDFGGVDREQVVGKKIWNAHWFQASEEARRVAKQAVEEASDGSLYREEVTIQGAENTEVIDFSVRPITDENGETTLLVPEGRLITSLKERERHLEVLHRFLRHNLRNKMTIIQGTARILDGELSDTEYGDHVSQIEGAAAELVELSETAHELSRVAIKNDDEQHPVVARRMLENARDDLLDQYPSATVSVDVEPDLRVHADWRLENVFEQLIENAVEHADPENPVVEVDTEHAGDRVRIRVMDEGPGIPSEELTGIVGEEEPTQLTHGTGFGLWLVRSVVDDYAGEVDYEARPEDGSVVSVELQRAELNQSSADDRSRTSKT